MGLAVPSASWSWQESLIDPSFSWRMALLNQVLGSGWHLAHSDSPPVSNQYPRSLTHFVLLPQSQTFEPVHNLRALPTNSWRCGIGGSRRSDWTFARGRLDWWVALAFTEHLLLIIAFIFVFTYETLFASLIIGISQILRASFQGIALLKLYS